MTNGVPASSRSATSASSVRRLGRPVSPSVDASCRLLSRVRNDPSRAPTSDERVTNCSTTSGPGGECSDPVTCSTPCWRPATVTGTHTAEHGPLARSRSFGHALIDSELSKTLTCPRRSATQLLVRSTGHPGAPATLLAATDVRRAVPRSESSSSPG